ncbi:MAG: SRPBCC domain-containing protein [Actinomycetota bacterium]
MTTDIVHAIEVAAEQKAVYDTIATPSGLAAFWTSDVEGSGSVGETLTLGFPAAPMRMPIEIARLDAPDVVAWTCPAGYPYWEGTKVSWSIAPGEHGTNVVFRHAGFPDDQPEFALGSVSLTWAMIVDRLKRVIENGGKADPFFA